MPEELGRRVDHLAEVVDGLRVAINRRTRWVWGTLACVVLAIAIGFGSAYYLIDKNNQKWCGTLNILTDPSAPAPTTARGRDQLAQLEALRVAFSCHRDDPLP